MGHGPKTLPRKGIADVQPKECARKMLSLSPTNPGTCSKRFIWYCLRHLSAIFFGLSI